MPLVFNIKVKDKKGCIAQENAIDKILTETISQPDAPLTLNYTYKSNPTFNGAANGKIVASINGGTINDNNTYTYEWKNSSGATIPTTAQYNATDKTYNITLENAPAEEYKLTVTDKNYSVATNKTACSIIESSQTLTQPDPIAITIAESQPISCNTANHDADFGNPDKLSDGVLKATVVGGIQPYQYIWSKFNSFSNSWDILSDITGDAAQNLSQGNYSLNVIDANGITQGTYSTTDLVTAISTTKEIVEPAKLELSFTSGNVSCHEGNNGENKLFGSTLEACDGARNTAIIDPQHLKDIKSTINNAKTLVSSIDSPLSTKKYVRKVGNFNIQKEELLNVLEDRFRMLYETTKQNIYFVPLSMAIQADGKQYFYDKETLDKLTKEVFESCGLGSNDVLLVLPYNDLKDTRCLPLGVAKKGSAVLSDEDLDGLTGNWDTKVLQLFSRVAKPLTVSTYYLTATNRIIRFSKKSSGNIKGYSAIKVLQFFESKGYAEINQLNRELNLCSSGEVDRQSGMILPCREVWSKYEPFKKRSDAIAFKYSNLELAAGGMQSKDIWNEISKEGIGKLREPFMDQKDITDQIFIDSKVNWTWKTQAEISLGISNVFDAKKHFYDFNRLTVLDDVVYSTLDAVGTIPGFDTFTDPAGAVYAGVRGDKGNAVIYGASFMIPFAGSAYIKGGVHEIKQADQLWGIVAKKADNVDGFVLDVKKISDIKPDEFHISSISYGNEKELTEKIKTEALKDVDGYVNKKNVKETVNELSLLKESKFVDGIISKKILKTITKYDKKLGKVVEYPMYNNVALGKDLNGKLKEFGDNIGANVWTSETDNVFTSMYDLMESRSFERNITDVLNKTTTNDGKILFDLTSVNIQKAIDGGLIHNTKLVLDDRLVTELELQIILRNKSWLENTIFHIEGKIMSSKELVSKGIKLIE